MGQLSSRKYHGEDDSYPIEQEHSIYDRTTGENITTIQLNRSMQLIARRSEMITIYEQVPTDTYSPNRIEVAALTRHISEGDIFAVQGYCKCPQQGAKDNAELPLVQLSPINHSSQHIHSFFVLEDTLKHNFTIYGTNPQFPNGKINILISENSLGTIRRRD